jgi:hypothetical protein
VSGIAHAQTALIERILAGPGTAPQAQRRAAFDNAGLEEPLRTLVDKIANKASSISDADVTALLASGTTEDQVFEIAVCAAIGEATRQYEAARAALDAAAKST